MSYSSYLPARTSPYTVSTLSNDVAPLVSQLAVQSAATAEVVKVVNDEMAIVGAHAAVKMAQLTQACDATRYLLSVNGGRADLFADFQEKILQITGQNILTLANTAQKEMTTQALKAIR